MLHIKVNKRVNPKLSLKKIKRNLPKVWKDRVWNDIWLWFYMKIFKIIKF